MSEPFLGEISMFGGQFAPRQWADCDGQLLAVSQNDALFSLFGTTYGGDGRTTFGLPDLRGRVPVHQGPGYRMGQKSGHETVTLTKQQVPPHTHPAQGTADTAGADVPAGALFGKAASEHYGPKGSGLNAMNAAMVQNAGGNGSHNNLAPYQVIRFIVCLAGIYPSRQ